MENLRKMVSSVKKSTLVTALILFLTVAGILVAESAFEKVQADLISKEDLSIPEDKLVLVSGNSLSPTNNPSNPDDKIIKKIPAIITAYSSTVWQTDDTPFITAANTWVRDGIIANNGLPFGTKVKVPAVYGDKIFVVEDRMNVRKSNQHFDIWFESLWDARQFGVKQAYIEVLAD